MTVAKTNGTTTSVANNIDETGKSNVVTRLEGLLDEDDEITLEDLAPDGGWGWMIALSMIIVYITTIGPSSSFGIIFGDFLEESGQAGMASSLFNSVFMINFSVASLLTNTLLKRYSTRPVGIMGALFFAIPDIMLAFVKNIYEMALLFFLQGFGLGLLCTVLNTVFNAYFVKRRAKVMSAAQVIIALGGIIFPTLTERMMKMYGFRGTAAIMGALSLNSVVGMTMMHPVEWHAKKPEEVRAERARARERKFQGLALSNRRYTIDVIHVSAKARWSSLRSLKEESDKEMPLLAESLKSPAYRVASISAIEGGSRSGRSISGSIRDSLARRISALSASSLINMVTGAGALSDIRQRHPGKKSKEKESDREKEAKVNVEASYTVEKVQEGREGKVKEETRDAVEKLQEESKCRAILSELLDMSLIRNCGFLNLCFGVSFVCTADYAFSSLLPLMMTDMGYTKSDAALTITVSGIAELASKVLLAIFTLAVDVKAKYLFFAAMILMEFARMGFLLYEHTLVGALVMITIIGVVRSWLLVPQPIVIIEDIGIEKFASAYGIFGIISGLVTVIFGALVGLIKDWTDSFEIYQISLLVMNGAFIVPWALQFVLVDLKKWRRQRALEATVNSLSAKYRP